MDRCLAFETEQLEQFKAGGREFKPFINFGNGHDKSSVLWANTSNVCTVCDNTFQMNLNAVEKQVVAAVNARHTKNVALRLPELGMIIRNATVLQQEFALAFEVLAETKIHDTYAEGLLVGFISQDDDATGLTTRAKNIVARLMSLFRSGRGNHGETLADLFSAVTDFYTHENAGNGKNPGKQFQSSEFGTGMQRKQEFWNAIQPAMAGGHDLMTKGLAKLALDK